VYGITVAADGDGSTGYTPNNQARIFDTSNPTGGDADLGTPNSAFGGPGVGHNGSPTNNKALGNVLIIQESNKNAPDDNEFGGTISFSFATPAKIEDVVLLDIEESGTIVVTTSGGSKQTFPYTGKGDNAVQSETINVDNVVKLVVNLPGSGAVAELGVCLPCTLVQQAPPIVLDPAPLLEPSACQQTGCTNYEGKGDYVVIGNSLSYDEDRQNCNLKTSASDTLSLPTGSKIVKAVLYWSASGTLPSNNRVKLNGNYVYGDKVYTDSSVSPYSFYGSEADVTNLVQTGTVTVREIAATTGDPYCTANAAYAAWTMVVVYENSSKPRARINVCTDWFEFTFPSSGPYYYNQYYDYDSTIKCVSGATGEGKTTIVTFESDSYKGEHFSINGVYYGDNLFHGSTAPNLDIKEFDVSTQVQSSSSIKYLFQTYLVYSVWGQAIEGLYAPVRVLYYEI